MIVGTTIIQLTTEEFKNYLINYFEKKEKMRLYKSKDCSLATIFHKEYDRQKYSRRRFIEDK